MDKPLSRRETNRDRIPLKESGISPI